MSPAGFAAVAAPFVIGGLFLQDVVAVRKNDLQSDGLLTADEEWPWTPFQDDLSSIRTAADAIPRFQSCEHIGIVLEGDANRPDMRAEALLWVDFLRDQGYCIAYFIDWARHASQAWSGKDITMNFGLSWKDALKEVDQSDTNQVVQILNSTKENWAEFTSGLEGHCNKARCAAKRVVLAFEDHGEYRLLGLPEHKKLMREEFLSGVRSLYRLNPDIKLLSYVSACKSGSMFGGPQYSAKELLQTHYFDCDLRDDKCHQGPITSQVAVIAGHSIVGVRQRVLQRATEGILQAQAMCDFAAGDVAGRALIQHMLKQLSAKQQAMVQERIAELQKKAPEILTKDEKMFLQGMTITMTPRNITGWAGKIDEAFQELKRLWGVFGKWKDYVRIVRFGMANGEAVSKAFGNGTITRDMVSRILREAAGTDEYLASNMTLIKDVDPSFDILNVLPDKLADLRESSFMQAFNRKILDAWFNLRKLVDAWKASENGRPIWENLTNGAHDAKLAAEADYQVPWGVACGTLSDCLETFGRAQVLSKLHEKELGCGDGLDARLEGHILGGAQGDDAGIEQNGGLDNSAMPDFLKFLLRAIAYASDEDLAEWDADLMDARGKLTTGDLDYDDDPMLGAALTQDEPLDLMAQLDGDQTRPESILAFSASVPQIISSSLLPFTVQSIEDLKDRVKAGMSLDKSFRAHARSVEDQTINQDSMNMDMMFGLYSGFMKTMMKLKGNEDATISITGQSAAERAQEFKSLAETSWIMKRSKERKALFYRSIANGSLPEGFLTFNYTSPATGRKITRYFDTMLSSENFGSPIAFGNMLDTDVTEFFHHVPTSQEKLAARLSEIGDDMVRFWKDGGDWFEKISEPKGELSTDEVRCCCKSVLDCTLLRGDELKRSRNPFKYGDAVCPSHLGYQHYSRFKYVELPEACQASGMLR
eukprot:TRINITY_DN56612_c0_g1_i1.p1 TRINITY_DN56612_c0_g1~~TRINITY_DN56612_c0_g1_i1.p1  ORF type:complete len:933 (-),score=186.03 TRINITY_DN56612_c0_g1_i1:112-2910(-)